MKLDILFHYDVNEQTGEMTFIGKEEITVDTKKSTTKSTTTKSTTKKATTPQLTGPVIVREENKLVLSQEAVDMLHPCDDCRIDIKYKKRDKQSVPVIGTDQAFGTKAGNKLTKSNTVSFRGSANEKLSQYGTQFTLEPTEDEGIFYLVGDVNPKEPEVPEEVVDIDSELDIESLDQLEDSELEEFDFNL